MDVTTLVLILAVWTVAGLAAAILFGKAIRRVNDEGDES